MICTDDAPAHVSEETTGASRVAPLAILLSVTSTSIRGLPVLIAFATTSVSRILQTDFPFPAGQLYLDVLGKPGMLVIWSIFIVKGLAAAMVQGVHPSRLVFAFSRDNALPGSRPWKRINPRTRVSPVAVAQARVAHSRARHMGFAPSDNVLSLAWVISHVGLLNACQPVRCSSPPVGSSSPSVSTVAITSSLGKSLTNLSRLSPSSRGMCS